MYTYVVFQLMIAAILLTNLSYLHSSLQVLGEHRTQILTNEDFQTSLCFEVAQAALIRYSSAL